MSWENRTWLFVSTSESGSLDFNDFLQGRYETTRKSNDGLEFMVKYDGSDPGELGRLNSSGSLAEYNYNQGTGAVTSGSGKFKFNHEETLAILNTPRWTNPEV